MANVRAKLKELRDAGLLDPWLDGDCELSCPSGEIKDNYLPLTHSIAEYQMVLTGRQKYRPYDGKELRLLIGRRVRPVMAFNIDAMIVSIDMQPGQMAVLVMQMKDGQVTCTAVTPSELLESWEFADLGECKELCVGVLKS